MLAFRVAGHGGVEETRADEENRGVCLGGLRPDNWEQEEEEDRGCGCRSAGQTRLSALRGAQPLFV